MPRRKSSEEEELARVATRLSALYQRRAQLQQELWKVSVAISRLEMTGVWMDPPMGGKGKAER